jgi:hypothetical protein
MKPRKSGRAVYQDHGRVTAERRETVQLVRQAASKGRHGYVPVNVRSDGNAPLPVQAFSEVLRA